MAESLTEPLLEPFTAEERRRYGREIVTFRHRLAGTGLFTDEALARLIDDHPRGDLDIMTIQRNPPPGETWLGGDVGELSGAELIAALKTGRLYLNVRRAMSAHPAYQSVFARLMKEFAAATGKPVLNRSGSVLVSSPRCGIFYHFDVAEAMLWHVRGVKTMYLYPVAERFLPERSREAVLLKENISELPYADEFEQAAQVVKLEPGDGVTWPMHAPHRVVNEDALNVSVSIEYSTPRSVLTTGVIYANGVARRRWGIDLRADKVPTALAPAWWAASKALKTWAPTPDANRAHPRVFRVDPTAPDCIGWTDGR